MSNKRENEQVNTTVSNLSIASKMIENGISPVRFNLSEKDHECFHVEVCSRDREKRCINYIFGRSDEKGCFSCLNNYARWDKKQPILCFHCENFIDKDKISAELKKSLNSKLKKIKE